jgi:hypothetical protein
MKSKVYFFVLLLGTVLLTACSKSNSTSNDELSTNQAQWKSKNFKNYSFTLRLICYCPPSRTGPHSIRVVNGNISSVNGLPYDENKTGKLYSIDGFFDYIKSAIAQKPFRSNISYNAKYGYPEIVYFDFNESIADDEIRYAIIDFTAY